MTTRANIKITILQVLDRLPAAYTQRVSALRAEVSLDCLRAQALPISTWPSGNWRPCA